MSFIDLQVPQSINSSDHDLVQDFFVPVLSQANSYDRGVGYFSSGWLKINARGLVEFAQNGGKARWITSPILSETDWEALKQGDEARQDMLLRKTLSENISSLQHSLEKDTLSALSWLVADGILEFKLAVMRGKLDGEFHDKFGIFGDVDGNHISFAGSYNESIQGTRNYESFKVFKSWLPNQLAYIEDDQQRFKRLWDNMDHNVRVLNIGASNKEQIMQLRDSTGRPYRAIKPQAGKQELLASGVTLRDYQETAIQNWHDNNYQGFFEMATGSGKTITSLAAAYLLYKKLGKLAIVVTVPYQHLVTQWESEAKKFNFQAILAFKSSTSWINELNQQIVEFNSEYRSLIVVVTTNATFCGSKFHQSILRISQNALLIADEAHHLGTETAKKAFPENFRYRLGLSATPDRWFDDIGTQWLRDYFGPTVFVYSLKNAIGKCLTEYQYYPVLVELTEQELEHYKDVSQKIARVFSQTSPDKQEEKLKYLLLERADILNNAENKLPVLARLIDEHQVDNYTLFYCSPNQLSPTIKMLGTEKGVIVHPFTAKENMVQRQNLLHDFAMGKMQALAAIRCLDEGVDVPNTRTAYLLASSGNPREFIQRRGRILRKAEGKDLSILYDLITVPPLIFDDVDSEEFRMSRQIVRKELLRFKEFADNALNKHTAIEIIWKIAERYHSLDF